MEERVKKLSRIVGPSYVIDVVDGYYAPRVNGREITVGRELLRLDAELSVLGESLASLLLPRVEFDDEVADIVTYYRRRVVAEEYSELVSRLGPASGLVRAPSYFFPLARMSKASWLYSCIFNEVTKDLESLGREYYEYVKVLGDVGPDDLVTLRPRSRPTGNPLGGILKSVATGISVAGVYMSSILRASGCKPNYLLADPYRALVAREGLLSSECGWPSHVVEVLLGRGECRRSSMLYASTLCRGSDGALVIKDYAYGTFKWLFAGIMSAAAYPFIETPAGRASNEYAKFLELRRLVRTPRVSALCITPLEATMVREYVDGESVLESEDPASWAEAGRVLATVHKAGYAMGDPNPGNVVIGRDGPSVIDLEQAGRFSNLKGAWDLAVFFYYARFFGRPLDLVKESVRSYVAAMGGRWKGVKSQLYNPRLMPFLLSLPVLFFELRSAVEQAEKGAGP